MSGKVTSIFLRRRRKMARHVEQEYVGVSGAVFGDDCRAVFATAEEDCCCLRVLFFFKMFSLKYMVEKLGCRISNSYKFVTRSSLKQKQTNQIIQVNFM